MWVVRDNLSWLRMLVTGGKALPRILPRVAVATGLSLVVAFIHERLGNHIPTLTATPFTLIGLPLGIFLGFRNSAAYDRFWEGRKLWGALVNVSRNVARQIMTVPNAEVALESKQEMARAVAAFAHGTRTRLRDEPHDDAIRLLNSNAGEKGETLAAWLKAGSSVPLFAVNVLASRFAVWRKNNCISDIAWQPLEQSLVVMTDILGACERIKNTPIPYSYTVLMHRIVAGYCILLPIGIADAAQWMTPVVVFFVSYALFGLDAVGEEIEQPFGHDTNDLPLTRLCTVIETDVRTISAQTLSLNAAAEAEPVDIET